MFIRFSEYLLFHQILHKAGLPWSPIVSRNSTETEKNNLIFINNDVQHLIDVMFLFHIRGYFTHIICKEKYISLFWLLLYLWGQGGKKFKPYKKIIIWIIIDKGVHFLKMQEDYYMNNYPFGTLRNITNTL